MNNIAFLDFEASSLRDGSYPIEVGFVTVEDDLGFSCLIRPDWSWTDWDPKSQAIHGLPRELLIKEGLPIPEVIAHLELLKNYNVYSDSKGFDQWWMDRLYDAHLGVAGSQGAPIKLLSVSDLYDGVFFTVYDKAKELGRNWRDIDKKLYEMKTAAERCAKTIAPPTHRALPDARYNAIAWKCFMESLASWTL